MVNVKDQIYSTIKDMANCVGDDFPPQSAKMPAIQYTEEDNKVHEWCNNEESTAYVRFRFDIWHNASTSKLACELDKRIAALGLKRTQCMDDNQPGYKHKVIRYEGVIDIKTFFVHHI